MKFSWSMLLILSSALFIQNGNATQIRTLVLGAYTTPREVYNKAIIPAFQKYWFAKTGQDVQFQTSFLGSGAQARAIVGGFEADVAALSLEDDIDTINRAGLIRHDWRASTYKGMVTRSIVVIAVRPGNPKQIRDWDDLRQIALLTPDIRTSGGAMWNLCAIYGAVRRGFTKEAPNDAGAEKLFSEVLRNVTIMDKGARESIITFERGIGDAAITYENEVLIGRQSGKKYEYVIPRSTILIENPVAVISQYADKHGVRDLADAFVNYLTTDEVQKLFMDYGLRPVNLDQPPKDKFPPVSDLFTIRDLGGWSAVKRLLFEPGALYDRVMAQIRK